MNTLVMLRSYYLSSCFFIFKLWQNKWVILYFTLVILRDVTLLWATLNFECVFGRWIGSGIVSSCS